jgi:mycobactin peptide synthetase MbtF
LDTDTSGTVGWFTTIYPVRVGAGESAIDIDRAENDREAAGRLLAAVAARLGEIPNQGLDYGLLRYAERNAELVAARDPQIQFNYVGRMDISGIDDQPWSLITDGRSLAVPPDSEPDLPLRFGINIGAAVMTTAEGPQLVTNWQWSSNLFTSEDADQLARLWQRSVAALAQALDG